MRVGSRIVIALVVGGVAVLLNGFGDGDAVLADGGSEVAVADAAEIEPRPAGITARRASTPRLVPEPGRACWSRC